MLFLAKNLLWRRSAYEPLTSDSSKDINPPLEVDNSKITSKQPTTKPAESAPTTPASKIESIGLKIPSNNISFLLHGTPMAGRKPLKKFEPFPGLPVELRLKIWKLALPRACKLEICGYPCSVSKGHSIIFQHASPARYPSTQAQKDLHYERALLRVCKESREVYHCQLPYVMLFESKARQSKPNWGRSTPTTRVIWHELRFGDEDVLEIKNFALMMTWTRKHAWKALVGHDWAPKIKALSLPSDINLDRAIILEKIMACFEGIQRINVGSVIWEKRLPTAEEWGQARMAKKV